MLTFKVYKVIDKATKCYEEHGEFKTIKEAHNYVLGCIKNDNASIFIIDFISDGVIISRHWHGDYVLT